MLSDHLALVRKGGKTRQCCSRKKKFVERSLYYEGLLVISYTLRKEWANLLSLVVKKGWVFQKTLCWFGISLQVFLDVAFRPPCVPHIKPAYFLKTEPFKRNLGEKSVVSSSCTYPYMKPSFFCISCINHQSLLKQAIWGQHDCTIPSLSEAYSYSLAPRFSFLSLPLSATLDASIKHVMPCAAVFYLTDVKILLCTISIFYDFKSLG